MNSVIAEQGVPVLTVDADINLQLVPDYKKIQKWSCAALDGVDGSFALRVLSRESMRELNHTFAKKNYPTNVLSFPTVDALMDWPQNAREHVCEEFDSLGDIAVCADVVAHEAQVQRKSLDAHWAHMIVHGVLHLRGYDHEQSSEAKTMEDYEVRLLAALGFDNPYSDESLKEKHNE